MIEEDKATPVTTIKSEIKKEAEAQKDQPASKEIPPVAPTAPMTKNPKPRKISRKEQFLLDKKTVTGMLKDNLSYPTEDLQQKFPNIDLKTLSGIRGYLKRVARAEKPPPPPLLPTATGTPTTPAPAPVPAPENTQTNADSANKNPRVDSLGTTTLSPEMEAFARRIAVLLQSNTSPNGVAQQPGLQDGHQTAPPKTAGFTPQTDQQKLPQDQNPPPSNTVKTPEVKNPGTLSPEEFAEKAMDSMKNKLKNIAGLGDEEGTDAAEERTRRVDEGSLVQRVVYLTPKTLIFFDLARDDGYQGDISSFLNESVTKFFSRSGKTVGIITKSEQELS